MDWLVIIGVVLVFLAGTLAGVIGVLWLVRGLKVSVQDDEVREPLMWVPSPHGPLRAPTDKELEWARTHPGERLPYIPGHALSDPYLSSGKGPAGSPGGPFHTEEP